ncbi:MAG TPA: hypothetical protein VIF14_10970 [Alphaproteobacteria bacterium]|jgi:hypothetical protein
MAKEAAAPPINLDKALLNPDSVFASPEEVRDHAELSAEQKIEILCRWEYDASEIAVASEEGMPGAENGDLLRRILLALEQLTHGLDVEHVAPTKQHGRPNGTGRRRRRR